MLNHNFFIQSKCEFLIELNYNFRYLVVVAFHTPIRHVRINVFLYIILLYSVVIIYYLNILIRIDHKLIMPSFAIFINYRFRLSIHNILIHQGL